MKDKYIKNPNISDSILMGNFLGFFFSFPPPSILHKDRKEFSLFKNNFRRFIETQTQK